MKLSLITVCFNSEATIEQTLLSVLNQTYQNYEYLVIDGKSNDKTLDIIKRYQSKFNGKLTLISEKDNGLYDAMNKGVQLATGDIIGTLNSDDILANKNVFQTVVDTFNEHDIDGTYSDLIFLNNEMQLPVRNFIAHHQSKHLGWHPPHPTLYLKKQMYDEIGTFNLDYKIAADYDFMLRMLHHHPKLFYIQKYLVKMRAGGVSTDGISGYLKNLKEADQVLRNNKIKFPIICNIVRICKTFHQSFSAKLNKNKIMNKLNND